MSGGCRRRTTSSYDHESTVKPSDNQLPNVISKRLRMGNIRYPIFAKSMTLASFGIGRNSWHRHSQQPTTISGNCDHKLSKHLWLLLFCRLRAMQCNFYGTLQGILQIQIYYVRVPLYRHTYI